MAMTKEEKINIGIGVLLVAGTAVLILISLGNQAQPAGASTTNLNLGGAGATGSTPGYQAYNVAPFTPSPSPWTPEPAENGCCTQCGTGGLSLNNMGVGNFSALIEAGS